MGNSAVRQLQFELTLQAVSSLRVIFTGLIQGIQKAKEALGICVVRTFLVAPQLPILSPMVTPETLLKSNELCVRKEKTLFLLFHKKW
jgi:hypothetical protein